MSREGNPEPQNQKHILDLMNVISEKENISNWVIYSKVSNMQKDLINGNYSYFLQILYHIISITFHIF